MLQERESLLYNAPRNSLISCSCIVERALIEIKVYIHLQIYRFIKCYVLCFILLYIKAFSLKNILWK